MFLSWMVPFDFWETALVKNAAVAAYVCLTHFPAWAHSQFIIIQLKEECSFVTTHQDNAWRGLVKGPGLSW